MEMWLSLLLLDKQEFMHAQKKHEREVEEESERQKRENTNKNIDNINLMV
ncbi:hypothetical protein HYC85_014203 [Camellia sinensis]|uniref:Uncharacterized protein n=1 Tax=Camellia sinensis TaxID=4442 RepID=A0A7J7H930_CAMSI|nr:hypothetical protein HYC85_014203 [Camellia sinensis]